MRKAASILLGTALLVGAGAAVYAQENPVPKGGDRGGAFVPPKEGELSMKDASVKDPPGPVPDPTHIVITMPDKLTDWKQVAPGGEQSILLFGDPGKPGPYGMLVKWAPGDSSHPHYHDQDRYITVLSGTWWVSSSAHFDPKQTYPIPTGAFVHHPIGAIHFDGARAGGPPVILELVGMGPVHTIGVDENGKPKRLPPGAPMPIP